MEVGTLQFWVGTTRYLLIRHAVSVGRDFPLESFALLSSLPDIRRELGINDIPPLPVIDLESDTEDDMPDVGAINIWHVGPVPNRAAIDRSNYEFLRNRGDFDGR